MQWYVVMTSVVLTEREPSIMMHMGIIEYMWKSLRYRSPSGNWQDIIEVEVCGAWLCPPPPPCPVHVWPLSSSVVIWVYPVRSYKCGLPAEPLCGVWSGFLMGSWGFLCVNVAICANSLHCLCNPWGLRHCWPLCVHVLWSMKGGYVKITFRHLL